MICTVIDNKLQAVSIFLKRKLARTILLEGRTTYHGHSILDASTPASVGGAQERIGILDIIPQRGHVYNTNI